jgi:hypothetical protein
MISVVPPDWRFRFMGSNESLPLVNNSAAIRRQVGVGKLDLTYIPSNMSVSGGEDISRFLTNRWIYETVLQPAEWLLIFQTDSTHLRTVLWNTSSYANFHRYIMCQQRREPGRLAQIRLGRSSLGSRSTLWWQWGPLYATCKFHHDSASAPATPQQQRARGCLADRTAWPSAELASGERLRVSRLLGRIDLGGSTNGIPYWWKRSGTGQWCLGRPRKEATDLGVLP